MVSYAATGSTLRWAPRCRRRALSLEALAGLGLAICARLAAEQGVRLRRLDSPVGTHIELSLPLAVRDQVEPSVLPRPRTSLDLSGAR